MAGALRVMPRQQVLADLQSPACQLRPRTDVEVLAIHEEALVKAVDLGVGGPSKKHKQPRYPVRHRRDWIARFTPRQYFQRRDDPTMLLRDVLSRLQDARRQQAGARGGLGDERRQHVVVEADVRVEHQEPVGGAARKGLVVVGAEAHGRRVVDALDRVTHLQACQQVVRLRNVERQHHLLDHLGAEAVELFEQWPDQRQLPVADDGHGNGLVADCDVLHGLISHGILGVRHFTPCLH